MKEVFYSANNRRLENYWYESGFQAVKEGQGQILSDSAGFSYLDTFQPEVEKYSPYKNGKAVPY